MIRPTLTADGRAVRLPLAERLAPVLDDLALAFAQDPETLAALLRGHAAAVVALDHAVCSEDTPDHVRSMRAAETDGTREALISECDAAYRLDEQYTPDESIALATALTKHAAYIRHTSTKDRT